MNHVSGTATAREEISAAIFDMDGAVTDTAFIHAASWKRVFDEFLRSHAQTTGGRFVPFDLRDDYLAHVEGRSHLDGARAFLSSRGIVLAEEESSTDPYVLTVAVLGDRKERLFLDYVRTYGVGAYPTTITLLKELRRAGVSTAVVSASRSCTVVLKAAGIAELFDVRVSDRDAERLHLPFKPEPALLVEAARRMGHPRSRTAVFKSSPAGVEAGVRSGFGLVIGVDRAGRAAEFYAHGAELVVSDLAGLC
ncbi:HAD family hydrolase [Salinactinospora qingdaonensis]|uniref:Uncharacterized protein n=1 Tax=Salinactinospora qingdaonensis TaxID=702744 RepID=A0ABP7FX22_9ACTN